MKKILILLITISLGACDILEQEPEALILTENAIVDRQSAVSAVNGLYNTLQSGDYYGGRFILATEMTAGNGAATAFQAFWQELATGRVPTANFYVEGGWVACYNAANAANAVIETVPDLNDVSDGEKARLLGVAYFVRGLAHFDLLRQFGEFYDLNSEFGIPLKLSSTKEDDLSEIERSTVAASYDQIEQDLTEAMNRLGEGTPFEASQSAAEALLARMHLYKGEYAEARAMADLVISKKEAELNDEGLTLEQVNYNNIYSEEGSIESIFEINFIQLEDGNSYAAEMYVSPPEVSVSEDLVSFFNDRGEGDRAELFDVTSTGLTRCIKYGSGQTDDGGNTIVVRLSEIYLIRAEAAALESGGNPNAGLADINTVRNRAGLGNITNISSNAELFEVLADERRAEFAFEGQYWFDIARYDLLNSRRGLEDFRKVYPIPFREVNISDGTLEQNPNYN